MTEAAGQASGQSKNAAAARSVWSVIRAKATEGVLVGALIAATGFGPEHWFAVAFQWLHLPNLIDQAKAIGLDFRLALVGVGVAVIVADTVWRLRREKSRAGPESVAAPDASSPKAVDEPPPLSIVVLPFQNMSDEPGQDYFVDGLVDDITSEMSRLSGAFVISRNTAFTYKGKPVDVKSVTRELNVRYALEGSIRKSGQQIRVSAQLIDGLSGAALWAERFDREVVELFQLQDALASDLAATLNAKLIEAESRRSAQRPNPEATDLIMQGKAAMNLGFQQEHLDRAMHLFDRAMQREPNNVDAISWYVLVGLFLSDSYRFETAEAFLHTAEALIRRALSIAPEHGRCKATLAMILRKTGAWDQSSFQYSEALRIDENYLWAYNGAALTQLALENYDAAAKYVEKSLKLSPRDPFIFWAYGTKGAIRFAQNRLEEARSLLTQAITFNPTWPMGHIHLIASNVLISDEGEVNRATSVYLSTVIGPKSIEAVKEGIRIIFGGNAEYANRLYEALRKAGFPER